MCCGKQKTGVKVFRIAQGGVSELLNLQEELLIKRMTVCQTLNEGGPCKSYSGSGPACSACGCNLRWKTRVPEESCPNGHWFKVA